MATLRDIESKAHAELLNHRLDSNIVLAWIRAEYLRLHQDRLVPGMINADDVQTHAWSGGTSSDPTSDLTDWRGEPAFIYSGDDDRAWVPVTMMDLLRRRTECALGNTREEWAVSALTGQTGRAYAVDEAQTDDVTVKSLVIPYNLVSGIILSIYHFQEPNALIDDSNVVVLPNGTEEVLVSYVKMMAAHRRGDTGAPATATELRIAREQYERDRNIFVDATDNKFSQGAKRSPMMLRLMEGMEATFQVMRGR